MTVAAVLHTDGGRTRRGGNEIVEDENGRTYAKRSGAVQFYVMDNMRSIDPLSSVGVRWGGLDGSRLNDWIFQERIGNPSNC